MAEFHFYGSYDDTLQILQALLRYDGIAFTPRLNYPGPIPPSFHDVTNELRDAIHINRGLILTGPFSETPLVLQEITGGKYDGTFVLDTTRGGPFLELELPMCKKLDGVHWHLGPGSLFHPREFWDESGNNRIPLSGSSKAAYEFLVNAIKSVVRRKKIGESTRWIGPSAISLLDRAEALILVQGNWLSSNGEVVKSNR